MKEKRLGKAIIYHIVVFIIGVIMIYPLLWMVMSSFKETGTIFTTAGSLIPETFTLENYTNGWKGFAKVPFSAFFKNSMLISVLATLGTIMSSALVAYGFARFKFFGHNVLFAAMLVTMMLPAQVLMIPQYLWYQKLGWVGTYLPLIVPYFFATQGFFVYMISNFIGGIPKELDEAAKIDGCNELNSFLRVTLPIAKPMFLTIAILVFVNVWNEFLWSNTFITSEELKLVATRFVKFTGEYGSNMARIYTASVITIAPVIILYLFFSRKFIEGMTSGSVKG